MKTVLSKRARNLSLMEDLIDYLVGNDMHEYTYLYANNARYSTEYHEGWKEKKTSKSTPYFMFPEPRKATDFMEYGNNDGVSLTCEGIFMRLYGGDLGDWRTNDEVYEIAQKYGMYPEQGNSWQLSFYEEEEGE